MPFYAAHTDPQRGCTYLRVWRLTVRRSPMGACDRYRVTWQGRDGVVTWAHEWRVKR